MKQRVRSAQHGNKAYHVKGKQEINAKDIINQDKGINYLSKINSQDVQLRAKENILQKSKAGTNNVNAKLTHKAKTQKNAVLDDLESTARPGSINYAQQTNTSANKPATNRFYYQQHHPESVPIAQYFSDTIRPSIINDSAKNTHSVPQKTSSLPKQHQIHPAAQNQAHSRTNTQNTNTRSDYQLWKPKNLQEFENRKKAYSVTRNSNSVASSGSQIKYHSDISTHIPQELILALGNNEDTQSDTDNISKKVISTSHIRIKRKPTVQAKQATRKYGASSASVKSAKNAIKTTPKTTKKVSAGIQKVVRAVKNTVVALSSNPVVLGIILVVLGVILLITIIVSSGGALTSSTASVKQLMDETLYFSISDYIKTKDTQIMDKYQNYENMPEFADIAKEDVNKHMNGSCSTRVVTMASYLYAKYENSLTYETATKEINAIHKNLYKLSHTIGSKQIEKEIPLLDSSGKPRYDLDGTPIMQIISETVRTLTVTLNCQKLDAYIESNINTLLPNNSQQEMYKHLLFTAKLWGSDATGWGWPFENDAYNNNITCHFAAPDVSGKPHRGTDFAAPMGTEILAVLDGTVIEVQVHPSWGNTVLTESENGEYRIRYAHMSGFNVAAGDTIGTGDVVGFVGNTGFSFGHHLHLEVQENGVLVNCLDYLDSE